MTSRIDVGSIVIRAYAWHCDEWGLVVDSEEWETGNESFDMSGIKNFTVMWPCGNLSLEMDVEILSESDYLELISKNFDTSKKLR
jgi:hypothetical protein